MRIVLCLGLFLCLTGLSAGQELELRQGGKTIAHYPLKTLKELAPPQALKLDGGTHNYWVLPLQPILAKAFGKNPYGEDITFVFVCSDGYRSPVKAEDLKKFPAFLAFESSDSKPFRLGDKELGPYYLVWDSERYPERKLGANWPFQVTAIERATFSQAYSGVIPPPKSSAQVLHGFALFRKHCLSCHQINGQGGNMGVDLNSPASVTEYIQPAYLKKIISNPASVRNQATMPGLDQGLPHRPQAIEDIVAYLRAKAEQRRRSKATKPAK